MAASRIQSLVFDKSLFTRQQALQWAKSNGFKYSTSRETDSDWRLRQFPPDECKGEYRRIKLPSAPKGIEVILCVEK